MNAPETFTLDEIAALTELPRRTVRYYIQLGLVDRPRGDTGGSLHEPPSGAASADPEVDAGGRFAGADRRAARRPAAARAAAPARAGTVEVWSHLVVADGLEITLEPGRAGLTPEQAREFFRGALALYRNITKKD